MKKNILSILTIMLILVSLISCDAFNMGESGATKGLASVSFGESATKGLTVSTNAAETKVTTKYWWYKATKVDGGPAQGAKSSWTRVNDSTGLDGVLTGFSVGYWNFDLYVQNDEELTGTPSNASFTVESELLKAGEVNYIAVDVGLDSEDGRGSLVFDGIKVPADGGVWTYSIDGKAPVSFGSGYDSTNLTLSKSLTYDGNSEETGIAAGKYTVVITGTYSDTEQTTRKGEISITVFDGITTTISGSIDDLTTAVEFVGKVYTLSYSANIADGSAYSGTLPFAGMVGGNVAVAGKISKAGSTFYGWNTKADGTGDNYQPGDIILVKKDITLYAMWTKPTKPTKGTAKVLSTAGSPNDECGWVQLWDDGVKFAEFNVGSMIDSYEDVTTYSAMNVGGLYGWSGTKDSRTTGENPDYSSGVFEDTATELWGEKWRMPTEGELDTLMENCTWEWCDGQTGEGHKQYVTGCTLAGYMVSGKGAYADNSIFLPAAGRYTVDLLYCDGTDGYYWSSTLNKTNSYTDSNGYNFTSSEVNLDNYMSWDDGCSVRAVLAE